MGKVRFYWFFRGYDLKINKVFNEIDYVYRIGNSSRNSRLFIFSK